MRWGPSLQKPLARTKQKTSICDTRHNWFPPAAVARKVAECLESLLTAEVIIFLRMFCTEGTEWVLLHIIYRYMYIYILHLYSFIFEQHLYSAGEVSYEVF